MTNDWVQHIGDDQLIGGMPKRMVASVSLASGKGEQDGAEGNKTYWTVHPKAKACEKCQAMAGIKFSEKPERPHPNCKCDMREHQGVTDSQIDCSHMVESALPGVGTTLLDKDFAQRVQAWRLLNSKSGISLTFSEGFRTTRQQGKLKENPNAITPAKAGTSLHEAGRAVDANVSRWSEKGLLQLIVDNASSVGISWGGHFSRPDAPHFYREVPGGKGNRGKYIQRAQLCAKKGI